MSQTKAQLLDNIKDDVQLDARKSLRFADTDSSHYVAFKAPATVSSSVTWTLPAADGSANYVLATDGSGTLSWIADPAGQWVTSGSNIYFTAGNVGIGDNSPSNPLSVTGASAFNGDVQFTGASYNVTWDKSADDLIFNDNAQACFGTGSDLKLYHNGTNDFIQSNGGYLKIQADSLKIHDRSDDHPMITAANDGEVALYFDNSEKLNTVTDGINLTGSLQFADDTNTHLAHPAADVIAITTGGTERVRVTSAGNFNQTIGADAIGFNQTAAGNHYIKNVVNANRTGADAAILAIHAQWNSKDVSAIKFRSGSDTTNKDNGHICFETSSANNIAEVMRLDNAGRLIIGHTTSTGQDRILQVIGTTSDTSAIEIRRHSADASSPKIDFSKSRNTTKGSNTVVNNGDNLGQITWRGDDGTDFTTPAATIFAAVDAAPGSNDMPGRLVFSTTPNGAEAVVERMRIDSAGRVGIGDTSPTSLLTVGSNANIRTANPTVLVSPASGDAQLQLRGGNPTIDFDCAGGGIGRILTDSQDFAFSNGTIDGFGTETLRVQNGGGISFNGDTAADNALDDYEQGTFTPTLVVNGNSNANVTLNDGGTYTKVGRHVYARAYITLTSKGSGASASSAVFLGGLPFTASSGHSAGAIHYWHNTPTDYVSMTGTVQSNSVNMLIRMATAAHDQANNMRFDGIQDGTSFIYSVSYEV